LIEELLGLMIFRRDWVMHFTQSWH